eukprot:9169_1
MNHSINNLLWITLFAVLYISNVIGPPEDDNNCGENGHAESCSDCQSTGTCLALTNKGPDGCGCTWKDGSCSPTGCGPNGMIIFGYMMVWGVIDVFVVDITQSNIDGNIVLNQITQNHVLIV